MFIYFVSYSNVPHIEFIIPFHSKVLSCEKHHMALNVKLRVIEAVELAIPPTHLSVRVCLSPSNADPQFSPFADPSRALFNAVFSFLSEHPALQSLIVELFAGNQRPVRVGKPTVVPVSEFLPNRPPYPRGLAITKKGMTFARLLCEFLAVDAVPADYSVSFSWGSYGPEYALSLTDNDGSSAHLSDLRDEELVGHHHYRATNLTVRKVGGRETLSGTIVGCSGIEETTSYATIQVEGHGPRVETPKVLLSAAPSYGTEFDFGEVTSPQMVELAVWKFDPDAGSLKIGAAQFPVKALEFDNPDAVEVKMRKAGEDEPSGVLKVIFAHRRDVGDSK
jgi:hypothetical protein